MNLISPVHILAVSLIASLPLKAECQRSQPDTSAEQPTLEQFMKIRTPNSPVVADNTLYVRDWPDGVNQLYKRAATDAPGSTLIRLTDFQDGLSNYTVSPDGGSIVLSASAGGSEQNDIHLLDATSGEIVPLLEDPEVVYSFQLWLPDSSGFIFSANDASSSDFYIYSYDISNKTTQLLLDEAGYWGAADMTNDGSRILVGTYRSVSDASAYELDVVSGELTDISIGGENAYDMPVGYLPGERSAFVISDTNEGLRQLYQLDLESSASTMPFDSIAKYEVENVVIDENRDYLALTYNEDGYASPKLYSLPELDELSLPDIEKGLVGSLNLRGNVLTYTLNNARTPSLAFAYIIGESEGARPLTATNDQGIDLNSFTLPQLIKYESFDGLEVPAFLYTPSDYTEGEQIPFVIMFHGGPEGQHRPRFSSTTQFLLSRGYGILKPNVRGSVGFGRAYHELDNYKKRWDSVRDGAEAARWLVANNYANPGEIAAYGGSYGGFMAVATVIEGADVFGAAIDVVGIVNFKTFLEQTKDYRRKLREREYGPLSDPEFLESVSPINRIDEINVPMMIAHGLNDPRVPVGEAMQLAVGLQKRGHDPTLLYFPDEGHGFAKLENRLLFAETMIKFLNQYIRK